MTAKRKLRVLQGGPPTPPEGHAFGLQPSMSWTAQLLQCSFAFGKDVRREPGEPALWGSAWHELQAEVLRSRALDALSPQRVASVTKRWGVAPEGMADHVANAYAELNKWLGRNQFKIDFRKLKRGTLIEKAVALFPLTAGRQLPPHDDDHRYHGLLQHEQPGTLDYAEIPASKKISLLLLDHKTGEEDFSKPLEKPQLLSLAAAVMRWLKRDRAIVGVLHARRRGMPRVYAEEVTLQELSGHESGLAQALARIGDGSMKPGPWCGWCPAGSMGVCPGRDGHLIEKAGDLLTGLTAAGGALSKEGLAANDVVVARGGLRLSPEKKAGLLYDILRRGEALAARARVELKKEILASGGQFAPECHDGYLTVRSYSKETLSKKGIEKAYGKLEAERILSKLKRDGAMTESTVEQLWVEKERGQ